MRLRQRVGALALLACIGAASAAPAARAASSDPVRDAVRFLVSRQVSNGAFFDTVATADVVAEAAAVVAAANGPSTVIDAAMAYVATHGPARADDRGGHAARIVLGIRATGGAPRAFAGTDYVEALRAHYNAVTGTYDNGVYANALAVLAAASVGVMPSSNTLEYFRLSACANGGMSHEAGCVQAPDIDTTAMAIIALRASRISASDPVVAGARRFLLDTQNADGGWGLEPEHPTNANSTGLAISAVLSLGERVATAPWRDGPRDPARALRALQMPSGAFSYLAGQRANDYATVQALPALAGASYPLVRAGAADADVAVVASSPQQRSVSKGRPLAQAAQTTPEPSPSFDPKQSRAARVEKTLGDRESGSGGRLIVLYLSMAVALVVIFGPVWWRRRKRSA